MMTLHKRRSSRNSVRPSQFAPEGKAGSGGGGLGGVTGVTGVTGAAC